MKTSLLIILLSLFCGAHLEANIDAKDISPKVLLIDHSYGKNKYTYIEWRKNITFDEGVMAAGGFSESGSIAFFLVRNGVVKKIDFRKNLTLELRPWDMILMETDIPEKK